MHIDSWTASCTRVRASHRQITWVSTDLKGKVSSLPVLTARLDVYWEQRDRSDTFKSTMKHSYRSAAKKMNEKNPNTDEKGDLFFHATDTPLKAEHSVSRIRKVSAVETDD